jgi:hypothetical protein
MEVSVRELVSGQGHPRLLVVLVAVVAMFAAVALVVAVALGGLPADGQHRRAAHRLARELAVHQPAVRGAPGPASCTGAPRAHCMGLHWELLKLAHGMGAPPQQQKALATHAGQFL